MFYVIKKGKMKLCKITKAIIATISFVILLFFVATTSSCRNTTEKAIEQAMGEDSDVDLKNQKITIETDDGKAVIDAGKHEWPNAIPNDVPEFGNGKIINVSTFTYEEGDNWTVMYEDVGASAFDDYKAALEKNGFKIEAVITAGEGAHISAKKDNRIVTIMSGEGMTTVSVGVEKP